VGDARHDQPHLHAFNKAIDTVTVIGITHLRERNMNLSRIGKCQLIIIFRISVQTRYSPDSRCLRAA
jgi:hypothetical protein